METLKICYIWSCRGLLPGPLYLLLCLSQHTVFQELEGSLQLPKYHRHIRRFNLYRTIKTKLYKNNAASWFNKTCRIKQPAPTYISIRINQSSRNLCAEQSPKDSDDTRCCVNTIVLLKMNTVVLETCRGM